MGSPRSRSVCSTRDSQPARFAPWRSPYRHASSETRTLERGTQPRMIIDCHGHYTTAPRALLEYRERQLANLSAHATPRSRGVIAITDDDIRQTLEQAQLKVQKDRGTDVTIFSPRAAGMGHHLGDATTSLHWSQVCNDLIHRVCTLFPQNFVGVCQLPQTPGVAPTNCIPELEHCIKELGFIGA